MASVSRKEQKETPIPGFPGWTEEKAEREAERYESDDFEITDWNWEIRVGPGSRPGDGPSPWHGWVCFTPAEYEELRREAKAEGISVNELVERQNAEDEGE